MRNSDPENVRGSSGLVETLYSRKRTPAMMPKKSRQGMGRTRHYKLVCISLYNRDIARLEEIVRTLREMGYSKANKSQVIRFALNKVRMESLVPKLY